MIIVGVTVPLIAHAHYDRAPCDELLLHPLQELRSIGFGVADCAALNRPASLCCVLWRERDGLVEVVPGTASKGPCQCVSTVNEDRGDKTNFDGHCSNTQSGLIVVPGQASQTRDVHAQ